MKHLFFLLIGTLIPMLAASISRAETYAIASPPPGFEFYNPSASYVWRTSSDGLYQGWLDQPTQLWLYGKGQYTSQMAGHQETWQNQQRYMPTDFREFCEAGLCKLGPDGFYYVSPNYKWSAATGALVRHGDRWLNKKEEDEFVNAQWTYYPSTGSYSTGSNSYDSGPSTTSPPEQLNYSMDMYGVGSDVLDSP